MGTIFKFLLRMPEELADALRKLAEAENRSLNAQIVHLLKQAIKK